MKTTIISNKYYDRMSTAVRVLGMCDKAETINNALLSTVMFNKSFVNCSMDAQLDEIIDGIDAMQSVEKYGF